MPDKSRHRKGKRFSQSKKRKGRLRPPALHPQASVAVQTPKSVSSAVSTPVANVSNSREKPTALRYPYVTTELRTIGILAVIALAILIVLALVLS